jgi:hypothetical protein
VKKKLFVGHWPEFEGAALLLAVVILVLGLLVQYKSPTSAVLAAGQTPVTHSATLSIVGAGAGDLYRSVSRCDAASGFTKLASVTGGTFTDTPLAEGTTYCYYVLLPGNVPTNELEIVTPTAGTVVTKQPPVNLNATSIL